MKKQYFQNIAKQLQANKSASCTDSKFSLLKVLEYWVRFLQESPNYLNPNVVADLLDFETQTELVHTLAKLDRANKRETLSAIETRGNYCGMNGPLFLRKYPNGDYHRHVPQCIENIRHLGKDFFSAEEWKRFTDILIPIFMKFAWKELSQGLDENDPTIQRIDRLQKMFHLSDDEMEILLYLWLQEYDEMEVKGFKKRLTSGIRSRFNDKDLELIPIATGLSKSRVAELTNSSSTICKLGILTRELDLDPEIVRHLNGQNEITCISDIRTVEPSNIPFETLAQDRPEAETLVYLLNNHDYKKPLNILFYGRAGTGKTELSKALAQKTGCTMYSVKASTSQDRYGDGLGISDSILNRRVRTLRIASWQCENSKSVILVDEADQMLNWLEKGMLNMLMEDIHTPIIWISNSMTFVEESTRRRFDFSMEFKNFTADKRAAQFHSVLDTLHVPDMISDEDVKAIAAEYPVTVGGYTKAIQNAIPAMKQGPEATVSIIRKTLDAHACLLEIACDNTREKNTRAPNYALTGLNIDQNVDDILEIAGNFNGIWDKLDGNGAAQSLNILLYGAPGTGKTEFVRYLARKLNRNLVIKRASDLLGMFVGQTEANIRAAFEEAEESKAILFFDEADSFLNDRSNAERNFEVQQVNELLTQMENFNGIFIAATNFNGRLDTASRRRFAVKVKFDYLTRDGIETVWKSFFPKLECPAQVKGMTKLAPGDFNAVYTQLRYLPTRKLTAECIAGALEREIEAKEGGSNRHMGF